MTHVSTALIIGICSTFITHVHPTLVSLMNENNVTSNLPAHLHANSRSVSLKPLLAAPALSNTKGLVFIGVNEPSGPLHAFESTCSMKRVWSVNLDGEITQGVALSEDNELLFAATEPSVLEPQTGKIAAVRTSNGQPIAFWWPQKSENLLVTSRIASDLVVRNATLYFSTSVGPTTWLAAVNVDKAAWANSNMAEPYMTTAWSCIMDGSLQQPVVVDGADVYALSDSGVLYRFRTGSVNVGVTPDATVGNVASCMYSGAGQLLSRAKCGQCANVVTPLSFSGTISSRIQPFYVNGKLNALLFATAPAIRDMRGSGGVYAVALPSLRVVTIISGIDAQTPPMPVNEQQIIVVTNRGVIALSTACIISASVPAAAACAVLWQRKMSEKEDNIIAEPVIDGTLIAVGNDKGRISLLSSQDGNITSSFSAGSHGYGVLHMRAVSPDKLLALVDSNAFMFGDFCLADDTAVFISVASAGTTIIAAIMLYYCIIAYRKRRRAAAAVVSSASAPRRNRRAKSLPLIKLRLASLQP